MKVLTEQSKKDLAETCIPGKFLFEIEKIIPKSSEYPFILSKILVFGTGNGRLTSFTSNYFPLATVIGYDLDREKIQSIENNRLPLDIAEYTCKKPNPDFDIILAHAVLHHQPEKLTTEALSFLPEGIIGVMDYDMAGLSREDFFSRWTNIDEEAERTKFGDDKTYRLHTSFGLEECVNLMKSKGVSPVFTLGNLNSQSTKDKKPTKHFIYIGIK